MAVGLRLVEPLADADVNVPGVMAMLVAPVAAQLSVLLAPELMLAGFAVKAAITGAETLPEDQLDEFPETQPVTAAQVKRTRTSAQSFSPKELSRRELNLFLPNESGEFIKDPFITAGHTSLVISSFGSPWTLARPHGCEYASNPGLRRSR